MWVTIEAREAGWCNGVNDGNLKVPPASPVEFDRCAMDVDAGTTATGTMTATLQHLPDPQIIENLLRQLQFQQQQTHLREQQHEQLASEVWTHEHSERHTPQAMRFHWPLSMCSGEPSQVIPKHRMPIMQLCMYPFTSDCRGKYCPIPLCFLPAHYLLVKLSMRPCACCETPTV
eukprot:TRINITY_DN401_c0_g1_i3.p1 TRINITY_DN401_c0_g1~~TRINITY_DN401_c0_g1_i3.p1  ORF type:complete len:174 (+),score=16.89 TRINITY_DN401_c0_g1_i3:282-803(+)